MKYLFLLLVSFAFLFSQERYSQVQIPVASISELQRIADLGIAVDHFDGKVGDKITVYLSESEVKQLTYAGIPYTVLIRDWQEYYNNIVLKQTGTQLQIGNDSLKYFTLGSKGGHFTLQEIEFNLMVMKQVYPDLITEKIIIGKTIENRNIYAVKISNNPDVNDASKPEVLYTALHHAREPQGMMTIMYYMWWLLENYNRDPEATYLVNNRQLWFIPVVNPDGYDFIGAGGMWRKNRRDNGDGSFGIDLNRNYGPLYMWNSPNGGSSTAPNSDTYRGMSPFSEPETFAVSEFMKKHNIKTCFNYHTYGNYLIYPWGFNSMESNDSLLFRYWSFEMTRDNRYSTGTDLQTVSYSTRGNSDDFMYGDTSKPRTFAMTPEVGISDFWAAVNEIIPLAKLNLSQNKLLAHYAGGYPEIRSFSIDRNLCNIVLRNNGIAELKSFPIYLSISSGIITPSLLTGDIPSLTEHKISLNFIAVNNDPNSSKRITIRLKDSTDVFYRGGMINDSITFFTGVPDILLNDSANTTSLWSTGSGWGVVTDISINSKVFTDSPTGNYLPNSDNSLTLLSPIDLALYQYAELKFQTKWSIEPTWDFGTVEVSTNGGTSWTSLKTQLSRKGSGRSGGKQPATSYGYDAFVPGLTWIEQTADLTPYVGKQIKIRFRVAADAGDQRDGLYVDDIRVLGYKFTPSSVERITSPYTYSLSQNFPNPFNPSTAINFSIEKPNDTSLRIYDVLGKEVAVLVNQFVVAGSYSINFDAKQLSSGIYFYRLTSGNYNSIKKMVVLK